MLEKLTPKAVKEHNPYGSNDQLMILSKDKRVITKTCRNGLTDVQRQTPEELRKYFGFTARDAQAAQNVKSLIRAVEEHLGFTKSYILIGKESEGRGKYMSIKDRSGEWSSTPMRSSLLTFILKNGQNYNGQPVKDWFVTNPDPDSYYGKVLNGTQTDAPSGAGTQWDPKSQYNNGETLRANMKRLFDSDKQPPTLEELSWNTYKAGYGGGFGISETPIED